MKYIYCCYLIKLRKIFPPPPPSHSRKMMVRPLVLKHGFDQKRSRSSWHCRFKVCVTLRELSVPCSMIQRTTGINWGAVSCFVCTIWHLTFLLFMLPVLFNKHVKAKFLFSKRRRNLVDFAVILIVHALVFTGECWLHFTRCQLYEANFLISTSLRI